MKLRRTKKGFTIVELIIVIAVIGILSAILIPSFISLTNKARETATQTSLNNAYNAYRVDALSSGGAVKYLEKEETYLSNEKNSAIAKGDVYRFEDKKWKKVDSDDLYELSTVYNGFDYQASKYAGFYAYSATEKLDSLSIGNPTGSSTIARYMSVTLAANPEPAGASNDVTWTTSDASKVDVSADGVINTCGETGQTATITATSNVDSSISTSLTVTIGDTPSIAPDEVKSIELPQFVNEYNANSSNLDDPNANTEAMSRMTNNGLFEAARPKIRRGVFYSNEDGKRDNYKIGVRNTFRFPYLSRLSSGTASGVSYCGPFLNYEIKELVGSEYVATDKVTTNGYDINFSNAYLTAGEFGQTFKLRVFNTKLNYEFVFETFDGYNIYKAEELCLFDNRDLTAGRLIFQDGSDVRTESNGKQYSVWLPGVDYWADQRNGISSDNVKGIALHNDMVLKNYMIPNGLKYTQAEIETYIFSFKNDFKQWSLERTNYYNNIYGDYTFDGKSELIGSLKDDTALFYRTTNGESFRFEGNYFTVDASELKPMYVGRTSNNPDPTLTGNLSVGWKVESHVSLFGANLTNNSSVVDNSTGSLSANSIMQYGTGTAFKKPTRGGKINFSNTAFVGNGDLNNDERYGGGLIMFKASSVTVNFKNNIVTKSYMSFMPQPCWNILNDQISEGSADGDPWNPAEGKLDYHADDTKFILERVKCYRSYNIMFSAYGTTGNEIHNSYLEDAGGPLLMADELNFGTHNNSDYGATDKAYYHTASIDITDSYLRNLVQGTESWFVQYPLAGTLLSMVKTFGLNGGFMYKNSIHGANKNVVTMQNNVPILNFIGLDVTTSGGIVQNFVGQNPDNSKVASGDELHGHISIVDNSKAISEFALDMTKVSTEPAFVAYNNMIIYQNEHNGDNEDSPCLMFATSGGGHGLLADGQGRNAAVFIEGLGEYVVNYLNENCPVPLDAETQETIAYALNNHDNLHILKYYGDVEGGENEDLSVEFAIPAAMFVGTPLEGLKDYVAAGIASYLNVKRDNLATGDYLSLYINMMPGATHYFGVLFGLM